LAVSCVVLLVGVNARVWVYTGYKAQQHLLNN
jgi:hypothetical protein